MDFEKKNYIEKIGKSIGYITMYSVFSILLFLILRFTHRIPDSWSFLYILLTTLAITLFGILLKMVLK